MRLYTHSICWALTALVSHTQLTAAPSNRLSIQEDGSLIVSDSKGSVSDFVKQGTPRQSVQIDSQSCNVSYGFNSAGKKTVLIAVPGTATAPVVFELGENQVTVPQKSALRITLGTGQTIEKMDSNPPETVQFTRLVVSSPVEAANSTPPPSQFSPLPPSASEVVAPETTSAPSPLLPAQDSDLTNQGWPGKLFAPPLTKSQLEEDRFYARTEFGPRFVSAMNLVSVTGPDPAVSAYNQKKIAFSVGYRQDIDVGVWLTDWFGLAVETGFALNAVRGNTEGMTISSSNYWTVPLLAQLCFQYPNDSGWIPYINFGFGGAWTVWKVGAMTYNLPGSPPQSLSGTGNAVTNAYQIAAGVRYRLYEELSFTMAYKFFGTSQGTMNLDNGVQVTLGSPVTQSAEVGLNFSF